MLPISYENKAVIRYHLFEFHFSDMDGAIVKKS